MSKARNRDCERAMSLSRAESNARVQRALQRKAREITAERLDALYSQLKRSSVLLDSERTDLRNALLELRVLRTQYRAARFAAATNGDTVRKMQKALRQAERRP